MADVFTWCVRTEITGTGDFLVSLDGKVVGVITRRWLMGDVGLGFAIPVNTAKARDSRSYYAHGLLHATLRNPVRARPCISPIHTVWPLLPADGAQSSETSLCATPQSAGSITALQYHGQATLVTVCVYQTAGPQARDRTEMMDRFVA